MIELIAIPAMAVARRVQGGVGPRWVSIIGYAAICTLIFQPNWVAALVAFGATCAMMLPSHQYNPDTGVSKRYIFIFALGYYVSFWAVHRIPALNGRCWSCWGELYLGGSWALALILASKLVGGAL